MSLGQDLMHAAFWLELARSDLATWIQLTPYVYAVIEGVHLVGIAFFFGPILLLDLALLGLLPRLSGRPTERFLLSIAAPAFAVVAASGTLMFISAADRYAASPVFVAKLGIIFLGGTNAVAIKLADGQRAHVGDKAHRRRPIGRVVAVVSLLVWLSAIVLGRSMGYELRKPPPMDFDALPWLGNENSLPLLDQPT
jgi:hypothetical protein